MSKDDLNISIAAEDDADWIATAQINMARETEGLDLDPATVGEGVRHVFEQPSPGFYIIARRGKRRIACLLLLREWSDWRNGDVWWIHSVFVNPGQRGRGVFREMFAYVEDLARKDGARGLRLYVDRTNAIAQAVYEKLGMNCEHYDLFEKLF